MSDSLPGTPVGLVPAGTREVPHSDLVTGLFRELLSRSTPEGIPNLRSTPNASLTPPTAGSLEALVGQAGADVSTPSLIAPTQLSSFSGSLPTQLSQFENVDNVANGEEVEAFIAPSINLAEYGVPETPRTEEEHLSLTLPETEIASLPEGLIAPPPIHPESPSGISPAGELEPSSTAGTSAPVDPAVRPELPFGEPLGPTLDLQNSSPSRNASGIEVLSEYSTAALPHGVSTTPDYYFLTPQTEVSQKAQPSGHRNGLAHPVPAFDLESVRRDFPALHQQSNGHPLVFLDNAATTQKPQSVIDATSYFYEHDNSNIHRAAYELAERATAAFENAREKVAQFLGAKDKKEIVFTRGTTEAINLVANTFGRRFIGEGDEILLTTLEHHANIVPWQLLAQRVGAVIKVVPINDRGELILEEYARLLSPRTKLVSVAHVSNSLGTVNPVEQIIQLAHAHGVHVLVDGAQSTPHLPVNVQTLDADFFVFSGHKVFGPTGIGALYGKKHLLESLPPWQGGGHMIQDVTFSARPRDSKLEHLISRELWGWVPPLITSLISAFPGSPLTNTHCWNTQPSDLQKSQVCAPSERLKTRPAFSPLSYLESRTALLPITSTNEELQSGPDITARSLQSGTLD